MKNKSPATKSKICVLAQVCKLIPGHLVSKIARKYGVDKQARTFSPWSHVVALLYAQLTHAIGLNDVCDGLRHHAGLLGSVRGAVAPARNTLSHANKTRDSSMMEALFWETLGHFQNKMPHFGLRYSGLPRRFKKAIYAIDSSTIALLANSMDWAKHRRRKAAAKCHLRLDLQSFLPACAIIEEASHHDDSRARQLCAGLKDGKIALFDKAYINFIHLYELDQKPIDWVASQFCTALYHDSWCDLGSNLALSFARFLWDSQWSMANACGTGIHIPTGFYTAILWDSRWLKPLDTGKFKIAKNSKTPKINTSSRLAARIYSTMGCL